MAWFSNGNVCYICGKPAHFRGYCKEHHRLRVNRVRILAKIKKGIKGYGPCSTCGELCKQVSYSDKCLSCRKELDLVHYKGMAV